MSTTSIQRREFHRTLLALAGAGLLPFAAQAQSFPAKPVHLIVTYPPGGSSDLLGRLIAQKLSELWGQPVLVESKSGAAGSIGMEYAARQAPDGYTVVLGNLGPAVVNPMISKLPYKTERDFVPIALTATAPNILCVPANSPYKTLGELLTAAREKPNTISFGTSGPGSLSHLATELLMRQAQVRLVNVPYKGGGQSVNDLLGGQIAMMIADALPVSQFIKAGRLRPLAITSAARSPLFPEIPTFAEGGVQGLVAENWWGLFLPAGTPKPMADTYRAGLVKVMVDAEIKEKLGAMGVLPRASTEEEFKNFLAAETSKYAKLVADNNIKAE
jgi:tripartite-type tricarboxylate transporter receptor subunit TctC